MGDGIVAILILMGSLDELQEGPVPASLEQDLAQADRDADPYLQLQGLEERMRPQDRQEPPPDPRISPPSRPPGLFDEALFSGTAWEEKVWDGYLTQPEVLIPLGLGISAAIVSHWDRRLEARWSGLLGRHRSYSDIAQYALLGSVVLLGTLAPGEGRDWGDELWTIGESYAATGLTVFMLKTTVGRPRPGGGHGKGRHSFPSGHSASAFTAATLIEENNGPLLGIPAYGLAAFTAFQRVEEGRHYPSDILAGAAIGIFSAEVFDHLHWGKSSRLSVGFADGLRSVQLELAVGF